ncbi:MAG TPA: M12 family metallo-peptidase, partial [Thermoanaerobaculia bacterium]|nr:M12 family metallo-peptidase [Thermoanaerobaculia bacterium]
DVVNEKAGTLTLNLEPGLELRAHRVNSYVMKSGSLVWSGVIEDPGFVRVPFVRGEIQFDSINTVMMVKNAGTITGNIHFNGEWYQIRPLKTGGHAIVLAEVSAMPQDHPEEYAKLPTYRMPARDSLNKADTVYTVMVHYTSAAASASGNISGIIDLAVAETNLGYTNSGVLIDVVLVHKSQVSYTESSNFTTNLTRYRSPSDGYMDSIHTTRNSVGADVGILIVNNTAYCGLASGIGSTASTAFAAVYWGCATGYYSFGHEIGHLQSARHDPANDPSTSPYSYGHGYRYTGSPRWRTIMAYDCSGGCPRLNYWSSPLRTYNGVPMGTSSQSDNARVLNNTRGTIAGFR